MIAADRYTKELAKQHLRGREPLSYWNDTIRLGYAENTGAFLSLGANWPETVSFWVFGIVPLLMLIGFFAYCIVKAREISFARLVPFALIFAGGTGNIVDRLMYNRHVTDFMNVGISNLRTGIFNVADMCVSAAVIILVIQSFKKDKAAADAAKTA